MVQILNCFDKTLNRLVDCSVQHQAAIDSYIGEQKVSAYKNAAYFPIYQPPRERVKGNAIQTHVCKSFKIFGQTRRIPRLLWSQNKT